MSDLRKLRQEEARALLDVVRRMRERLTEPATVYAFTPGGEFNTATLGEPSARDVRDLMAAYGDAMALHLKLSEFDGDENEEARGLLGAIADALGVKWGAWSESQEADHEQA